jgi:hypothetical protein
LYLSIENDTFKMFKILIKNKANVNIQHEVVFFNAIILRLIKKISRLIYNNSNISKTCLTKK